MFGFPHPYSAAYVPDGEDNAVKEYLRMWDAQKLVLKKIEQQITAFVLRLGKQYTGGKSLWTENHLKWLRGLDLMLLEKEILQEYLITYDYLTDKLECLDARIEELARNERYGERVFAVWAASSESNRIWHCRFRWSSGTSEELRKRRTLPDSLALSPERIPAVGQKPPCHHESGQQPFAAAFGRIITELFQRNDRLQVKGTEETAGRELSRGGRLRGQGE